MVYPATKEVTRVIVGIITIVSNCSTPSARQLPLLALPALPKTCQKQSQTHDARKIR